MTCSNTTSSSSTAAASRWAGWCSSSTPTICSICGRRPACSAGNTITTVDNTGAVGQYTSVTVGTDGLPIISYYGDNLIGIAVPADSRWTTLGDLIAEAKANPGKLNYGSGGIGTTQHLSTEALTLATGATFMHIPQQGSAGSMTALLGKHVDFITETSVWAPHVAAGRVRLLAVTSPKRASAYPDVPTFAELGVSPIRSVQAIIGPAGMPEPERKLLETAFRKALKDPGFVNTMKTLAMEIIDLPGPEVKKLVEQELLRARVVVAKMR